jgi:hypothetical protein
MLADKKMRELEKARRQSGRAIPVVGCVFLVTVSLCPIPPPRFSLSALSDFSAIIRNCENNSTY